MGGTHVIDIISGTAGSNPTILWSGSGAFVYFVATNSAGETGLWTSDGTLVGTQILQGGWVTFANVAQLGGLTIYNANQHDGGGLEPWVSDGTPGGTRLLADIFPGTGGSNAEQFTVMGDRVFFVANRDNQDRGAVWVSDGTPAGTEQLVDTNVGSNDNATNLVATDALLFFSATDGTHGSEPWVSDGTTEGTRMLADIRPDNAGSSPRGQIALNGGLLFTADDGVHGSELWTTVRWPALDSSRTSTRAPAQHTSLPLWSPVTRPSSSPMMARLATSCGARTAAPPGPSA